MAEAIVTDPRIIGTLTTPDPRTSEVCIADGMHSVPGPLQPDESEENGARLAA